MTNRNNKATDLGQFVSNPQTPSCRAWNTNSDSLCNYMSKITYLKMKLKKRALIPRYVEEPLDYLQVSGLYKIAFPMICFCDIPFSKIQVHIDNYGKYGIAFDKTRLLDKYGIQPIHYISKNSPLRSDFKEAYLSCIKKEINDDDKEFEILSNYLLSTLVFMKPVSKIAPKENNEYIYQNECEWRFVPGEDRLPDGLDFILKNEYVTQRTKRLFSKMLEKHDESWIKFDWSDVKYIIVPSEKDALEIIDYVRGLKITDLDKNILISKIEVTDRLMEDI